MIKLSKDSTVYILAPSDIETGGIECAYSLAKAYRDLGANTKMLLIHPTLQPYTTLSKLNLPIRIQLFIKSKAAINIGYQSGVNDTISGLAPVICTPSTGRLGADYLGCIKYLR